MKSTLPQVENRYPVAAIAGGLSAPEMAEDLGITPEVAALRLGRTAGSFSFTAFPSRPRVRAVPYTAGEGGDVLGTAGTRCLAPALIQ